MKNQKPPPVIISAVKEFKILKHEVETIRIPLHMAYIYNGQVEMISEQSDHYNLLTKKAAATNLRWNS